MQRFRNIAVNAFIEVIRQPIFLLRLSGFVAFEIVLAVPCNLAFGDPLKPTIARAMA